jgi:hypothetical protein
MMIYFQHQARANTAQPLAGVTPEFSPLFGKIIAGMKTSFSTRPNGIAL